MEQYEIPPDRYFENIQLALKHFKAEWIYIRLCGSLGGKVIISKKLKRGELAIARSKNGLNIIINGKKVFVYKLSLSKSKDSVGLTGKRWAIAYERFYEDGRRHFLYPDEWERFQDNGPLDPSLPKVKRTILRSCHDYLIEITFSGKIPIKKLSLVPGYQNWHYWKLDI